MDIPYKILRSRRKTVALHITNEGMVELRCPLGFPARDAAAILERKRPWIEAHLARLTPSLPPFTPEQLAEMKRAILPILEERAALYASILGVSYGKITVRSQKSLWGSCSQGGNLSFNCLLAQVPEDVLAYVVVHELCHRKHMNHSPAFWQEVAQVLPDYKTQRRWLKENGGNLIRRIGR